MYAGYGCRNPFGNNPLKNRGYELLVDVGDSMKIETLSVNPFVAVVDEVFDAAMAKRIIDLGAPLRQRARVINETGKRVINDMRTGSAVKLSQWENPDLTNLTTTLSSLVRMPPENSEPCSLLHYTGEQEFQPHSDALRHDASGAKQLARGGQRLFTTICYLNDLDAGGETEFPSLRVRIRPKLGRVLIFGNTRLGTAEAHPHTIHAGKSVTNGEKWALTHWWRQLAYHVQREYPVEDGTMRRV